MAVGCNGQQSLAGAQLEPSLGAAQLRLHRWHDSNMWRQLNSCLHPLHLACLSQHRGVGLATAAAAAGQKPQPVHCAAQLPVDMGRVCYVTLLHVRGWGPSGGRPPQVSWSHFKLPSFEQEEARQWHTRAVCVCVCARARCAVVLCVHSHRLVFVRAYSIIVWVACYFWQVQHRTPPAAAAAGQPRLLGTFTKNILGPGSSSKAIQGQAMAAGRVCVCAWCGLRSAFSTAELSVDWQWMGQWCEMHHARCVLAGAAADAPPAWLLRSAVFIAGSFGSH